MTLHFIFRFYRCRFVIARREMREEKRREKREEKRERNEDKRVK